MTELYAEFLTKVRLIQHLSGAESLLGWDQEVCLPPAGTASRADHLAALATVIHEKMCDPRLGDLVEDAGGGQPLDPVAAADVREFKRERDRAVRLPSSLVAEFAAATALAHADWVMARERDDWSLFAPHLARLVDLSRRKAEAIGYAEEPYDALLDEFEPGARAARPRDAVRLPARRRSSTCCPASKPATNPAPRSSPATIPSPARTRSGARCSPPSATTSPPAGSTSRPTPSPRPWAPATSASPAATTRADVFAGLYACLHEGGHALYEQGLPAGAARPALRPGGQPGHPRVAVAPVGEPRRPQPRVRDLGRCRACATAFGGPFLRCDSDDLYRAANVVRRSLIRIEADEVTYNLHIILRMEIERALLRGDLAAADVAAVWREKMRATSASSRAPTPRAPCRTSTGAWARSATSRPTPSATSTRPSCGTTLRRDVPGVEAGLARGEFAPVLGWLRAKSPRARPPAARRPTSAGRRPGRRCSIEPYLDYLNGKFGALYGARLGERRPAEVVVSIPGAAVVSKLLAGLARRTGPPARGPGGRLRALPPHPCTRTGVRITGLDISAEQIANNEYAHEKIVGDVQTWQTDRQWDAVICIYLLEHVEDPARAVREPAALDPSRRAAGHRGSQSPLAQGPGHPG